MDAKHEAKTLSEEPAVKRIKLKSSTDSETLNHQAVKRKFTKIPIFIVDYHNDVLEFIYRCFGSRHLPLYNNTIIHFDSHPDMVIPREIEPEIIFDKNKLLENLSIENWIMPTCYGGHFKKIVWIKNSWCKQINCGDFQFNIGDYNNELQVDLNIPYFVSEGNYCRGDKLKNKKEIILKVIEIDNNDNRKMEKEKPTDETKELLNQDIGENKEDEEKNQNINDFINQTNYILDIDLDYFSTANPFLNIYEKIHCYEKVTEIFNYQINENDFENGYEKRKLQLDNLKEIFQYLDEHRQINDNNELIIQNDLKIIENILQLIKLMKDNYNDNEIDWILIYNAGCTTDNNGLPHYITSDKNLEIYFNNFKKFVKNLKFKPIAITISRSSDDGYCPLDKVDFIQENILKILNSIYYDDNNNESLCSNPILWYKDQNWDIMKL